MDQSKMPFLPLMNSEDAPFHRKIEQSFMSQLSPLPSQRSNQLTTQRDRFNRTTGVATTKGMTEFTSASNGKSSLGKTIHRQLASIQVGISDLYQKSIEEQEVTRFNSIMDETTDADTQLQT